MLKSMTAYARAALVSAEGRFTVEIQSLNRKFLDIFVQLPRELAFFEAEVRKWVAARVLRGKVSIRISASYDEKTPIHVSPNLPLARQLKSAWEEIAEDLEITNREEALFQMLTNESGIFSYSEDLDEDEYKTVLKRVIDQALDALIEMKSREGSSITQDFQMRIQSLHRFLDEVKSSTQDSVQRYQEKLTQRVEELLPGAIENEERILREICIYADKVDITEEITRLESHLEHFSTILQSQKEEKGKLIEFLLQEMQREVNTIGSKASEVTQIVVEMKNEIERIREQVQNVE